MKRKAPVTVSLGQRIPAWRWYAVAGAMAGAFALVMAASSKHGLGADPDSVAYLSAADNVLAGRGLMLYDGAPFLSWPPFYPWLLAAVSAIGLTSQEAARYLHAGIFSGIILLAGAWLARHLQNAGLFIVGLLAILLARPLVFISVFILSEQLFLLLVMGLLSILATPAPMNRLRGLAVAVLLAAAASMTRYVGVVAILTGAILMAVNKGVPLRRRLVRAGVFTATAALPLFLWLLHNRVIAGSTTGWRQSARIPAINNIRSMLDTVSLWFFPPVIGFAMRSALLLLMAIIVSLVLWLAVRRPREHGPSVWQAASGQALWAGLFLMCLTGLASLVSFNLLQSRLLAPVFPSLLFLLLLAADRGPDIIKLPVLRRAASFVLVILLSVWLLVLHVKPDLSNIQMSRRFGAGGYSSIDWQETELSDFLRRQPLSGRVYSNAPDALYFIAGRSSELSPTRKESAGAVLARPGSVLVWFRQINTHPGLQDLDSLLRQVSMKPLYVGKEGIVLLSNK